MSCIRAREYDLQKKKDQTTKPRFEVQGAYSEGGSPECLRRVTTSHRTAQTYILTQLACGAVAKSHALCIQAHLSRLSATIATLATH